MHQLRQAGVPADTDYAGRKPKGQMKQAARTGARLAVIVGADELAANAATVRDMESGEQQQVLLDALVGFLKRKLKE
jgi:histidyl-tRNA synthetase